MSDEFPRPTRSLSGRVAIVSGAGAAEDGIGNGRASAILLAEAGCSVVCTDIKQELAQRTVEMIEKDGFGKAVAVAADATKEDDCKNAVKVAVEKFGRLDILVNVVGVGGATGTAVEVDMGEWCVSQMALLDRSIGLTVGSLAYLMGICRAKSMELNVATMVKMAKYAIPEMEKNTGQWRGSIVNIASVAGIRGGNPHLLYPTSKGAIVVSQRPPPFPSIKPV